MFQLTFGCIWTQKSFYVYYYHVFLQMDTQCKMVRELLSIKEMSRLLLKETSGRLGNKSTCFNRFLLTFWHFDN